MSIQAVKCPSCGSSDTVELRANNYICRYCETKFKWVEPNVQTTRMEKAVCECGREAKGHCAQCNAEVCDIHSRQLWDCIHEEAREYFLKYIYPLTGLSLEFDRLLCLQCYEEAASALTKKVEELKNAGNLCSHQGCFSLELTACQSCGIKKYCLNHLQLRKQIKRRAGLFGKPQALRYQRICDDCYTHARQYSDTEYLWE